jgi:hypothetical protein
MDQERNEEVLDKLNVKAYSSPNIVRVIKSIRMRWVGNVVRMGRGEACTGFGGETWGKRPLGRTRCRWEDNIKMDLQEVGCGGMGWIELAQDRDRWPALVNVVMNLQVPYNAGNFLTCCKPVSFSRRVLLHGVST